MTKLPDAGFRDSPVDVTHTPVYRVRQAVLTINDKLLWPLHHASTKLDVSPAVGMCGFAYVSLLRDKVPANIPVNAEDCRTLAHWFTELALALEHETKYKE